jgi:uncharacterized protein YjiS (DUF1127 family)
MINPAYALHPLLVTDPNVRGFGVLRWLREQIRYARAMHELNGLEADTLDDIGIAREQFPELARRHARGLPPLERPLVG